MLSFGENRPEPGRVPVSVSEETCRRKGKPYRRVGVGELIDVASVSKPFEASATAQIKGDGFFKKKAPTPTRLSC